MSRIMLMWQLTSGKIYFEEDNDEAPDFAQMFILRRIMRWHLTS